MRCVKMCAFAAQYSGDLWSFLLVNVIFKWLEFHGVVWHTGSKFQNPEKIFIKFSF